LRKLSIIERNYPSTSFMESLNKKYISRRINKLGLGLILFYVILASGCAATPAPYSQPMMPGPAGPISVMGQGAGMMPRNIHHVVGPQETLWRISKTYGVDMNTLLRVNNIQDPTMIKKGQVLLVPQTTGPKPVIPLYPTNRWTHIVIHHTATDGGDAFTIDSMHLNRGWENGMGYHFLINNGTEGKTDGQIQVGPRWIKQMNGAHCKNNGMNERGIGISLVGNFSEEYVTGAELDSLVFLVRTLQEYYRIPSRNVIGHRDVPGARTECPGTSFPWAEFKARIS